MTPTRFRECLDALHWTQRGLARILNRPEGTVRQWARGAVRIPPDVAAWLERVAGLIQSAPPPYKNVNRGQSVIVVTSGGGGGGSHSPPPGGGGEPLSLEPNALDGRN